jgi:hypothetical protein
MTTQKMNIKMSDDQMIKIFSTKFMVDIINSAYQEILGKNGNKVIFAQDKGKYIAFLAHINASYDNLSKDERVICSQAGAKVIDMLKLIGDFEEANAIQRQLNLTAL